MSLVISETIIFIIESINKILEQLERRDDIACINETTFNTRRKLECKALCDYLDLLVDKMAHFDEISIDFSQEMCNLFWRSARKRLAEVCLRITYLQEDVLVEDLLFKR